MKKKKTDDCPVVSEKRFETGFRLLDHWLCLKQSGKSLAVFFEDNLVENIAIYGMGALGERLYDELQDSRVKVCYGIDRMASIKNVPGLKIYSPKEPALPKAEAIVVTPVQDYWIIADMLEMKIDAAIISLEDIIDYCMAGD